MASTRHDQAVNVKRDLSVWIIESGGTFWGVYKSAQAAKSHNPGQWVAVGDEWLLKEQGRPSMCLYRAAVLDVTFE